LFVATRRQDQITGFTVQFPDEPAEAAHRRAMAMVQRYRLDRGLESFDAFLPRVQRRRAAGEREYHATEDAGLAGFGASAANRPFGSAEEPQVSVSIPFQYNTRWPWAVDLAVRFAPE
jgi:hypothetical protein